MCSVRLLLGDCLEVMRTLPDSSVDSVVTDPPAGIAFMGKAWDGDRGGRAEWVAWLAKRMAEAYRVARPGTYALVWALPRTSHWTATAVEDAGWTIRDRVTHLFGTGFPKAKSCLKPGAEDWWLAYKPGGKMSPLQIDACRIAAPDGVPQFNKRKEVRSNTFGDGLNGSNRTGHLDRATGRWPANVVLDEDAAAMLDEMSGQRKAGHHPGKRNGKSVWAGSGGGLNGNSGPELWMDSGGASRFFYVAKASRADRGPDNDHPTVKNTDLMRWLCRLITPPGGTVLDPFMGSGSTGKAARLEGLGFLGIEQDAASFATAERRTA